MISLISILNPISNVPSGARRPFKLPQFKSVSHIKGGYFWEMVPRPWVGYVTGLSHLYLKIAPDWDSISGSHPLLAALAFLERFFSELQQTSQSLTWDVTTILNNCAYYLSLLSGCNATHASFSTPQASTYAPQLGFSQQFPPLASPPWRLLETIKAGMSIAILITCKSSKFFCLHNFATTVLLLAWPVLLLPNYLLPLLPAYTALHRRDAWLPRFSLARVVIDSHSSLELKHP